MEKVIRIGEKEQGFKATASTVRRYREKFGRDLLVDINKILPSFAKGELGVGDLEIFENMAYIMAYQYDSAIPEDPEEWLDQFEMMDVYKILPELVNLWGLNSQSIAEPKKKARKQSAN